MTNESSVYLNSEQKKAVEHSGGPILVVAGAGTGKTRVITERIKWLIENKKAKPEGVLALTFTEKAAGEMLDRVDAVMPLGYEEPWLSTFHAFAERILRDEGLEIGLDPAYKILTPPQAWLLVRQNLFKFDLNYYRPLGNPTKFISALLTLFSRAQDEDVGPEEFLEYAGDVAATQASPDPNDGARHAAQLQPDGNLEEVQKTLELANAYQTYQNLKIEKSYLDFGDLILWTLKLFRERPSVLKKYQDQFKYILVDEFQDTNFAQYQLIKLMAPAEQSPELLVCGDDDQAIYRFRGAAVSNIIQFREEYPKAETIVLTKNYRSGQKILDAAYRLIQNNNPDRLEEKLEIEKKLQSQKTKSVAPETIHTSTGEEEADEVVKKIRELKGSYDWRDFAILARANNHLDSFVAALKRQGVPYQLIGNRGLFDQEEVREVIAILRTLANPRDNISLYRLLNTETLKIEPQKIVDLLNQAYRTREDLYDVAAKLDLPARSLIERYRQQLAKKSVTQIIFEFLNEINYINPLLEEESIENNLRIKNLNLFLQKVKSFEAEAPEPNVIEFVNYLDLMIEAGESPAQAEIEDIDTVNLLTVHAAKGLEFPVVFLVNLVSDRFPTRDRKDPLPLPDDLIKEILPAGNVHIQEERRLFYVGSTRAKEGLFLSFADNYGGVRRKKPSVFIGELGIKNEELGIKGKSAQLNLLNYQKLPVNGYRLPVTRFQPKFVSYSQLETFSRCPLQYKYRYVLTIPTPPNHALSFGQTIHRTLRDFHRQDLFKDHVDLNQLLKLYQHHWLPEGYDSKEHQEYRFKEGQKILKEYFEKGRQLLGEPVHLEKKFTLKIGRTPLIGSIDRVDRGGEGEFEVIDYKTGQVKEQKYVDRDDQLSIYALAAQEALGIEPQSLSLFFIDENKKMTTKRTNEQLAKKRREVAETIGEIKGSNFEAQVGRHCNWCAYKNVCPAYRRL